MLPCDLLELVPELARYCTATERRALAHLAGLANAPGNGTCEVYYGKRSLAKKIDASPTTVRVALQKLRAFGILTNIRAIAPGGELPTAGEGKRKRYATCMVMAYQVDLSEETLRLLPERVAHYRKARAIVAEAKAAAKAAGLVNPRPVRRSQATLVEELTPRVANYSCLNPDGNHRSLLPLTGGDPDHLRGASGAQDEAGLVGPAALVGQGKDADDMPLELLSEARARQLDAGRGVSRAEARELEIEDAARRVTAHFMLSNLKPTENFPEDRCRALVADWLRRGLAESVLMEAVDGHTMSRHSNPQQRRHMHAVFGSAARIGMCVERRRHAAREAAERAAAAKLNARYAAGPKRQEGAAAPRQSALPKGEQMHMRDVTILSPAERAEAAEAAMAACGSPR